MKQAFLRLAPAVIIIAATSPAFAEDAKIDAADTAWMIGATGLVLMMTIPGLALFYAGMVRKKNVLATMAQSLAATFLVSILWAFAGYSLAFTGEGAIPHKPAANFYEGRMLMFWAAACDRIGVNGKRAARSGRMTLA